MDIEFQVNVLKNEMEQYEEMFEIETDESLKTHFLRKILEKRITLIAMFREGAQINGTKKHDKSQAV